MPRPVLDRQDAIRRSWLAQPDEWYFSGKLHEGLRDSAAAAATTLVPGTSPHLPTLLENPQQVCLVENATVGAVTVARRWAKLIEPGDVVIHLDIAYKACVHVLREHCAQAGATLVEIRTPFLASTEDEICAAVEEQLKALCSSTRVPRYAFLDHVSSQPAVLLPAKRLTAMCRDYGCEEVAVDGAHSVGSVHDLDVVDMDCDFFFSNLHKWGFAPGTATVFFCKTPELAAETHHPITSWDYPQGIAEESLFPGTRDFSAILAVPTAVEYLKAWRSADGLTSAEHCKREVQAAAAQLRFVWESEDVDPAASMEESLIATQVGRTCLLAAPYISPGLRLVRLFSLILARFLPRFLPCFLGLSIW